MATPIKMTEARLNDLVYMTLKKFFFEAAFGSGPRACDIRVCMDMSCTERITPASAILLPNEKAGTSHDITYDVDTDVVFKECVVYLEDHWMKQSFRQASGDRNITRKLSSLYKKIVKAVLETPEDDCGVDYSIPEPERAEE